MPDEVQPQLSLRRDLAKARIEPLKAGTSLNKFIVGDILRQDAFSATYRAHDRQLDCDVAIREYLPEGLAVRDDSLMVQPESAAVVMDFLWGRTRFLDEAWELAALGGCAGIVHTQGRLAANGTAYAIMTHVRGETLASRLSRLGRLRAEDLDRLVPRLLDGLEHAHSRRILHLDITPENIVLDENGNPALVDFGGARAELAARRSVALIHVPGYGALEQFSDGRTRPATDIYALAATLYHCVTGRMPLPAISRLMEPLVPASQAAADLYPAHVLAGIDTGLALRPAERPASIAEWRPSFASRAEPAPASAARFVSIGGKRPTPGRQPPSPGSWREPGVRRLRTRLALVAAVLVLVAGGVLGVAAIRFDWLSAWELQREPQSTADPRSDAVEPADARTQRRRLDLRRRRGSRRPGS